MIAGFRHFKNQWLTEGALPLWLPKWYAGMVNIYSLTEYLLVLPFSFFVSEVAAYKIVGLLLMAAGTVGVYRLLRLLSIDRVAALIGGLIFAIHPQLVVGFRFFGHFAFILTTALLPFYLYEIYLLSSQKPRPWPAMRAALMLALIFTVHLIMGIIVSLMTVGVALLTFNRKQVDLLWGQRAIIFPMLICAGFALSAFVNLPLWIEGKSNMALFDSSGLSQKPEVTYPIPSILFFFDRMGALLGDMDGVRKAAGNTPLLLRYPISSGGCYLGWSVFLISLAGAGLKRKREDFNIFYFGMLWLLMAWMALGHTTVYGSYRMLTAKGSQFAGQLTLVCAFLMIIWAFIFVFTGKLGLSKSQLLKLFLFLALTACVLFLPGFVGLSTLIPFFQKIRAPSQFLVPAFVLLPIIVGAAVNQIRLRLPPAWLKVVTAIVIILVLVDFYPYRYGSLREVSAFALPRIEKMTAFLQKQPERDRVFYSHAYSPPVDYAISAMGDKGSFSYWLNWAAPKYIGAYRTRLYDSYIHWLETEDSEKYKALLSMANIRFVLSPRFEVMHPEEPALERVFHNLLIDLHEYKGAGGTWQIYPAQAVRCKNSLLWDEELLTAFKQKRAMVADGYDYFQDHSADSSTSGHNRARVMQWERPSSDRCWAEVDISGDAILMWSESFHPAWRVLVDGKEAKLLRVNYAFMGVRLPEGKHYVEFTFGPYPWRWLGALISVVSFVALLSVALIQEQRSRRSESRAGNNRQTQVG